jgi:iron(III) transport system substrate-binding protein
MVGAWLKGVAAMMKFMTVAFALCTAQAFAQTPGADLDKQWKDLVAAAQKEGKVVILAPPDAQVRQALPAAFKKRFGIEMDYLGGRSSESAAKLRAERDAGVYTVDAALAGIQTMAAIFYREKMLDPLAPVLILPEVTDGSKWKSGKLWFMDPEQQYILRLFNSSGSLFHLNEAVVKVSDIKSSKDLIDPKYKGKIITHDPTVPGTGSNDAARIWASLGEDFARKLYIDQKPMIVRDRRQVTDLLARGTYPIAFGAEDEELEKLRKDGFKITAVYNLPDLPGSLSAGIGEVALLKNAPHPNAAKVFVNWIASKEGLETLARARGEATTRADIDEKSFLHEELIPKPGVDYFDTFGWDFTVTEKEDIRLKMKEILHR